MWKTRVTLMNVFHQVTFMRFVDKVKYSENLLVQFTGYIRNLVATLLSLQG